MRKAIAGATVLLMVAARFGLLLFALGQQHGSADINRYFQIVNGGVPYRDQAVEYPPVSVGLLELLHVAVPGRQGFGVAVVVFMAAVEALLCVLMWRGFGARAGIAFLILNTPLYFVLLTRLDEASVALTALYVTLVLRAKPLSAAVIWVGAVGAKLWPFPLGAYLTTSARDPAAHRRALLGGVISAVVLGGIWLAVGGIDGIRQVLTSRGSHGWQIESLPGSVLHAFAAGPVYGEGGAVRIGHAPPGLALGLTLVGAFAAVSVSWWAGRQRRPATGWVAAVMCLLATSTLLSPQFITWAIPGAALAVRESRPWLVAAVAATVVLTLGVSTYGSGLVNGDAFPQALLLMRNVAVLGTLAVGVHALVTHADLARRSRD